MPQEPKRHQHNNQGILGEYESQNLDASCGMWIYKSNVMIYHDHNIHHSSIVNGMAVLGTMTAA